MYVQYRAHTVTVSADKAADAAKLSLHCVELLLRVGSDFSDRLSILDVALHRSGKCKCLLGDAADEAAAVREANVYYIVGLQRRVRHWDLGDTEEGGAASAVQVLVARQRVRLDGGRPGAPGVDTDAAGRRAGSPAG